MVVVWYDNPVSDRCFYSCKKLEFIPGLSWSIWPWWWFTWSIRPWWWLTTTNEHLTPTLKSKYEIVRLGTGLYAFDWNFIKYKLSRGECYCAYIILDNVGTWKPSNTSLIIAHKQYNISTHTILYWKLPTDGRSVNGEYKIVVLANQFLVFIALSHQSVIRVV